MKLKLITQAATLASIRKPMPQPSLVMGEGKRKNLYKRKEKFKSDWRSFSD